MASDGLVITHIGFFVIQRGWRAERDGVVSGTSLTFTFRLRRKYKDVMNQQFQQGADFEDSWMSSYRVNSIYRECVGWNELDGSWFQMWMGIISMNWLPIRKCFLMYQSSINCGSLVLLSLAKFSAPVASIFCAKPSPIPDQPRKFTWSVPYVGYKITNFLQEQHNTPASTSTTSHSHIFLRYIPTPFTSWESCVIFRHSRSRV